MMRGRAKQPLRAQAARRAELDAVRRSRPLTAAEVAEADSLDHRAYMRAWRAANS